MVLKRITCSNITKIWLYIQVWIQKQKVILYIHFALLYSCHYISIFVGSRAGLLMPLYYMYIYIYIFRWWLDTAGSVSPKGRLRLDGVCCDWAFALLCFWCRICDHRDAGSPSYPLIMWWRCRDLNFWSMLWYGACLEVAIVPVRCYSFHILKSLQVPSLTPWIKWTLIWHMHEYNILCAC